MEPSHSARLFALRVRIVLGLVLVLVIAAAMLALARRTVPVGHTLADVKPRTRQDTSGYYAVLAAVRPWAPDAPAETVEQSWRVTGRLIDELEKRLVSDKLTPGERSNLLVAKAMYHNYDGDADKAYDTLRQARAEVEPRPVLARGMLANIVYYEGVTALRRGENENCIQCRGESSCILPISRAAVHTRPAGSRLAIHHFGEYLDWFPDDLEVRWLLNVAHMTLGEYPAKVDPRRLIALDTVVKADFDIGKFRDVGHLVHVDRQNKAGGAIMDDFDNDGRLDLVTTTFDPTEPMAFYRNREDGTFEDRSRAAGLAAVCGGLYCVQTDYDNDGRLDVFIPRGAWFPFPMRGTLLHNDGGSFTDVTKQSGLDGPMNSNSASWADYDNDGYLDVFVCCERQPNQLYHNRRDGTFEEVANTAGLHEDGRYWCKGAAWIDYDNDDFPDLFVNRLIDDSARLYHNNRDGSFTDVSEALGVDGPHYGFSCWTWDYDNDGWLDLFATSYDGTVADVVQGLTGRPHRRHPNKLFRNVAGKGFEDVTREAGLDLVYATMGSNLGDFDNDGFLDMYLGTGDPYLGTLVPNRMFKNADGKCFVEITFAAGTGHLQKGHAVACGDWDRDGDTDIFVNMGGAVDGDRYHNILFQNPGQGNHWLVVKLVGRTTNRAAIGARIKAVTAGNSPRTLHRLVSSGSSFGANSLQQTLGLGRAERIATLEVHWPTSGTTQVFHDIAVDRAIEVTELSNTYRPVEGYTTLRSRK
ncbi:MAG: CRTAC1 family protein [Isosphaeraceae bacterium]|nr:CRTAC1 family protein [Isosphaeraceae bacterium]